MAIASALLMNVFEFKIEPFRGLQKTAQRYDEENGEDLHWLVRNYVERAMDSDRRLDRLWWLRAIADVVQEDLDERKALLRLAARHISSSQKLSLRARNSAIRFLYAKSVVVSQYQERW